MEFEQTFQEGGVLTVVSSTILPGREVGGREFLVSHLDGSEISEMRRKKYLYLKYPGLLITCEKVFLLL